MAPTRVLPLASGSPAPESTPSQSAMSYAAVSAGVQVSFTQLRTPAPICANRAPDPTGAAIGAAAAYSVASAPFDRMRSAMSVARDSACWRWNASNAARWPLAINPASPSRPNTRTTSVISTSSSVKPRLSKRASRCSG